MPATIKQVTPGEVYAVPLFLTEVSPATRFGRRDAFADRGAEFAYLRVIAKETGSGLLAEVFDLVGPENTDLATIVEAPRLFRPVATTRVPVHKRRWRLVGRCDPYDPETDSGYSRIQLALGPLDQKVLWQGGQTVRPLSAEEVANYERWTIWFADDLEKRILTDLGDRAPAMTPWA